jgi:hypothetical protein
MSKHPKTLGFKDTKDKLDGVDYINVYSRGNTNLGRLLSNFARTPFEFLGVRFESVEGFWYTKTTGQTLNKTFGAQAKKVGRSFPQLYDPPSADLLIKVYEAKLCYNPYIIDLLLENKKPFAHYYLMYLGHGRVSADKWLWTADLWRELTDFIKTYE